MAAFVSPLLAPACPVSSGVSRLVLTNCDSYEHFPPKGFAGLVKLCRTAPPLGRAALGFFASKPGQRAFLKSVCTRPPNGERANAIFGEFATSSAALRTTQSLEPSITLDAVDALRAFGKPVLLAWGDKDKLFPLDHAKRLEADFPRATLEVIKGASTYVMIDDPAALASSITKFIDEAAGRVGEPRRDDE